MTCSFMGYLILIGLKRITCWLDKTPWLCIQSHHVLWFHCVRDGWSFFLFVPHVYVFSHQSRFIYHLRNYGVVEQSQYWFLNIKLAFTS